IAAVRVNQQRLLRRLPRSYLGNGLKILNLTAWGGLGIFACYSVTWFVDKSNPLAVLGWLSLVAAPWALFLSQLHFRARVFRRIAAADSGLRSRRTVRLESGGLRGTNAHGETWVPWNVIQAVEEWHGLVFLYLDEVSFIVIPLSAFPNTSARTEF